MPDFARYITERAGAFTGRTWVFQAIHGWLARPDASRYFLLTGEPGSGKTAIAARLSEFSAGTTAPPPGCQQFVPGFLHAVHFCRATASDWLDPRAFARSVSLQLAAIPAFARALKDVGDQEINIDVQMAVGTAQPGSKVTGVQIDNLVIRGLNGQEAFNRLVLDPLRTIYNQGYGRPTLLLVDSLDEALSSATGVTIVDLLAGMQGLHELVRCLLTSRQEPRVEHTFRAASGISLSDTAYTSEYRRDIADYVGHRIQHDERFRSKVAALSQAETSAWRDRLTTRADGNFLYVTFFLDAVARDQRSMEELEGLPPGLDGLYADSLQRLIRLGKQDWAQAYAPLMGLLSVAQESLTLAQLQAFMQCSPRLTLGYLSHLQQFIETVGSSPGQRQEGLRYQLYHQSIADFLRCPSIQLAPRTLPNPYYLPPDEWHGRIADHYLATWGGMERGLPALPDPRKGALDGGYGLRHLASHLEGARRAEHLHTLLALEQQETTDSQHPLAPGHEVRHWTPIWYAVRDAVADLAGFLDDVTRARRLACEAVDQGDISWGLGLGRQCRYALLTASVGSLAANLSPALLADLVASAVWEPPRGLAMALQMPDPLQQARALVLLAPYVPPPTWQQLLAAAFKLANARARAEAIADLAHYLSPAELEQALTATCALPPGLDGWRGGALIHLAPYLPAALLPVARAAAQEMQVGTATSTELQRMFAFYEHAQGYTAGYLSAPRYEALAALARRQATLGSPREALAEAQSITHDHWCTMATAWVIPYLPADAAPGELLRLGLDVARRRRDGVFQAEELVALAVADAALPEPERLGIWREAWSAVQKHLKPENQPALLADLAPYVPAAHREAVLRAADPHFDDPDASGSVSHDAVTLQVLACCHARLGHRQRALALATHLWDGRVSAALTTLEPCLSEADRTALRQQVQQEEAHHPARAAALRARLAEARALRDGQERAQVLAALAPLLTAAGLAQSAALQAATSIQALSDIADAWERHRLQCDLAQGFAQAGGFAEALATIRSMAAADNTAEALQRIAPHLPQAWLPQAEAAARSIDDLAQRAQAVRALAGRWAQLGHADQALEVLQLIEGPSTHTAPQWFYRSPEVDSLTILFNHLPSPTPLPLLDALLADIQRGRTADRDPLLALLLPKLAEAGDTLRAHQEAQTIATQHWRIQAQAGIALYPPDEQRASRLDTSLSEAEERLAMPDVVELVLGVVRHLDGPVREDVLARARAWVLAASTEHTSVTWVMRAVTDLAALCPENERQPLYQKGLDAALTWNLDHLPREDLIRFAHHLSASQLAQLSARLSDIRYDFTRDEIRAKVLGRFAQLGDLDRALQEVDTIRRAEWQGAGLAAVAPYLDEAQIAPALEWALSLANQQSRADALAGLAPRLDLSGLTQALAALPAMDDRYPRRTALTGLARRLAALPSTPDTLRLWGNTLDALARSRAGRAELLSDLQALAPILATAGGNDALWETCVAVQDVGRWWP